MHAIDCHRRVAIVAAAAGFSVAALLGIGVEALRNTTTWTLLAPLTAIVAAIAAATLVAARRLVCEHAAATRELQAALEQARTAEAERSHLDGELSNARDQLEELLRNAPLAIAKVDRDYTVEFWNPAAEALFGWKCADLLGKPIPTIPEEERAMLRELVVGPLERNERVVGIELERLRADGTAIHISMSAMALRNSRGEIEHIVGFMHDLESRRAVEAQLLQAQKLEAVGRLAGGVAHDFNNLLTVIKSSCDFVLAELPPAHALRPDVEEIEQAADRAAGLTRQLLAFSRRQNAQPRAIDLASVAEGAQKMLRRLIGEDIRLETDLQKGSIVEADPGLVEQVLVNLAVNARDAMPSGGRLQISVADDRCAPNCKARTEFCTGRCVRLSVEDDGMGIDEKVLPRIFEPFFTTKEKGVGTGLGLSTVYGIVEQAHGSVRVHSKPGKGTRFDVYLPGLDVGEVEAPVLRAADLPAGAGHVLVAEDEQAVRRLAVRTLRACGYTVYEAPNGVAALELATSLPTLDLVLSDVVMPGMVGPALVQELQRLRPGLRYLFMSGYTSDELERHKAVACNVPLFEKPFSPYELAAQVRAALDGPAAAPA